jgi:hypothetical protein
VADEGKPGDIPAKPADKGEFAGTPSPKSGHRFTKPGPGRPKVRRISSHDVDRLDAEDVVGKLFHALAFEAVRVDRDVIARGGMTDAELKKATILARAVETCAQAKRHLIEAAKAEDLSNIPTEQLVRVVVSQMRKLPELAAAVTAEIGRRKPAVEAPPA